MSLERNLLSIVWKSTSHVEFLRIKTIAHRESKIWGTWNLISTGAQLLMDGAFTCNSSQGLMQLLIILGSSELSISNTLTRWVHNIFVRAHDR
jgi:hypothetical protein